MITLKIDRYEEAAALIAAGAVMLKADFDTAARRVVFQFENPRGKAAGLLDAHRLGRLQVESRKLTEALTSVKNLIFARRGERGGAHE